MHSLLMLFNKKYINNDLKLQVILIGCDKNKMLLSCSLFDDDIFSCNEEYFNDVLYLFR